MRARSQPETEVVMPPTLSDLGISKSQSSRWQLEASVPEEVFERHVVETKAAAVVGVSREAAISFLLPRTALGLFKPTDMFCWILIELRYVGLDIK